MNASCVLSFLPRSRCASIANNIIQIARLSPSGRMHGSVADRDNLISGPILVGAIIQRTVRGAMVVAPSPKQPRQRHRANRLEGLRRLFPLSHLKLVPIKTDIDESHISISLFQSAVRFSKCRAFETGRACGFAILNAAIQLEIPINDWCVAHSRPDLLRIPPAAPADDLPVGPGRRRFFGAKADTKHKGLKGINYTGAVHFMVIPEW